MLHKSGSMAITTPVEPRLRLWLGTDNLFERRNEADDLSYAVNGVGYGS